MLKQVEGEEYGGGFAEERGGRRRGVEEGEKKEIGNRTVGT